MSNLYYIIILAIIICILDISISVSFSKKHKLNIEKFKPGIFPEINLFFIFSEGMMIGALTFMITVFLLALSNKPIVFMPIGILLNGILFYYYYRRNILFYCTETKIILWNPRLFDSVFLDVEMNNIDGLIFAANDEFSPTISHFGRDTLCFINFNSNGHKKSIRVNAEKYDLEKLMNYFKKNDKPIYTKVIHEKTAKPFK